MSEITSSNSNGIVLTSPNVETVIAKARVANQDGTVLRGENAVLDAGDTYITNRPQS